MSSKKGHWIIRFLLLFSVTAGFFSYSYSQTAADTDYVHNQGRVSMEQNSEISIPKSFFNLLYRDCRYLFFAEISSQTGYIMRFNKEPYSLETIKEFGIASGKQKGAKKSEWDLRTPIGFYEITEFKPGHTLHQKFGPGAYVLNYPNPLEKAESRTGSGIWIHGTDRIDFVDFDSEGCIRIRNSEFPVLADYLETGATPVIIVDKIRWVKLEELLEYKDSFQKRLRDFHNAVADNETERIKSFYHRSFYSPHLNMDYVRLINYLEKEQNKADFFPGSIDIKDVIFRDNTVMTVFPSQLNNNAKNYIIWKDIENQWLIIQQGIVDS